MSEQPDTIHPMEDAILECLEAEDVEAALAALQQAHPEHKSQILRVTDRLRSLGAIVSTTPQVDGREQIGPFQILQRLGEGGMGVVYRAWQDPPGREVALKIIRPELMFFDGTRSRFQREVEASVRLTHPSIVPVYEVGSSDGVPWFSMAYVRGRSLAAVIQHLRAEAHDVAELDGRAFAAALQSKNDEEPTPKPESKSDSGSSGTSVFAGSWPDVCLHLLQSVASALHHAHLQGVMHRDVKPSNVMLSSSGHAMLLDFGLAHTEDSQQLTNSQSILGSLPYMPPEMLRGAVTPSPSLDVYSLGVTLYECLTLENPFLGPTPEITRRNVQEARPVPPRRRNPRISRDLQTICLTAMAEDPRRRYANIAEFAQDMERVRNGEAIAASPDTPFEHAARFVRRNRVLVTSTLLIILVLIAGVAFSLSMFFESEQQRTFSERTSYRANIGFAEQALRMHRVRQATRALQNTQTTLRSWEWRHLLARLDASESVALRRSEPILALATSDKFVAFATRTSVEILDKTSLAVRRTFSGASVSDVVVTNDYVYWIDGKRLSVANIKDGLAHAANATRWTALAVSPNYDAVAAVAENGDVQVHKPNGLQRVARRKLGARLTSVAITKDRIACGSSLGRLFLLDRNLETEPKELRGHRGSVDHLAFDPEGERLASAASDRLVFVWSARTGEREGSTLQHDERLGGLLFHPFSNQLLTAADQGLHRWSLYRDVRTGSSHGHPAPITGLAWQTEDETALSPGGDGRLLTVSTDGTLRRWQPGTTAIRSIQQAGPILSVVAMPGGVAATMCADHSGRVFNTVSGAMLHDTTVGLGRHGVFACVSPDNQKLAVVARKGIRVMNVADWTPHSEIDADGCKFCAAAFSPDGTTLATCGREKNGIALYSVETGRRLPVSFPELPSRPRAIQYTPDGQRLVVCGEPGIGVRVFSVAGSELAHLARGDYRSIAVDARGRVAAGGPEGASLWSSGAPEERRSLPEHPVHTLVFEPTSGRLVTAGPEGIIRVFDETDEMLRLGSVGTAISSLAFDSPGTTLLAGDNLGVLRAYPAVAPDAVEARLAAITTKETSGNERTLTIEAESCAIGPRPKHTRISYRARKRFSGGYQIWWSKGSLGQSLTVFVPVPVAGRYRLEARFENSFDFCHADLTWNKTILAERLDLQARKIAMRDYQLGEVQARAGLNEFKITIAATPKPLRKSKYPNGVGLDRLTFTKLD